MNSEMILDWETLVTRSDTVREFSTVCLMYGMALADALDDGRPIGLIQTTVLGSPIESWVSPDTILKCNTPESPPFSSEFHIYKTSNNQQWNEFILPLTKISIRGMIWSQGESNLDYNPELYVCHLHNFMKDVSSRFFDATVPVPHENNISFPFGVVQAGPMNNDRPDVWGDLRWSQSLGNYLELYSWLKGKFFVSTYDLTDNSSASKVGGPRYRVTGGEWRSVTDIRMVSARNLEVAVPAEADTLAYAWSATVCTKYRDCAIYSDDEDALPAMPWLWRLSDSEKIRREKKYIVHGTYFVQYPSNKTKVSIGDWIEYY
ncbi:hypothetical protein B566_EDAN014084 [Ephemera danica]|nr:hypothetical protein B566_EDAN014084 [Ephemera danica]